jgi:hypothetical protein
MCNCGNKRNSLSQPKSQAAKSDMSKPLETNTPHANFEYTGKTALTVVGNITGKSYRFSHAGDIQIIDHRDAPGMKLIPVLKRIYA